jgi:oxygen-independent coproporphyrinogen-3 oxidase
LSGIYIHIPFCRQKCHYCNFFSLASRKSRNSFTLALKKEIELTSGYLADNRIETIYLGGGTPSVFHPEIINELVEAINRFHAPRHEFDKHSETGGWPPLVAGGKSGKQSKLDEVNLLPSEKQTVEITIEANPDDIDKDFIAALRETAVNRISLGIQTFDDASLNYLNRSHSSAQALYSIRAIQDAGYDNISIDLIYGIPRAGNDIWMKNLETAFAMNVPHISAYALTVETGTPLAWMINRKKSLPVNEEDQANQFRMVMEMAEYNGYEHYEISNFCKPGFYSKHNTNYWNGTPYLGLGPSAHSYNGQSRRWNISNLFGYISNLEQGNPVFEEEVLSLQQRYNEYVMTSLRTMWGCNTDRIRADFGPVFHNICMKNAGPWLTGGMMTEKAGILYLTFEGKLFADRISSDLFFVN